MFHEEINKKTNKQLTKLEVLDTLRNTEKVSIVWHNFTNETSTTKMRIVVVVVVMMMIIIITTTV